MRSCILLVLSFHLPAASAQSLDIGLAGHGLSVGDSRRFTGIRINAVDRGVEQVRGLNLSLWNPGENPDARYGGIALGLIGTKAMRIDGIALSGIGVNAAEELRGVGAGILGVGASKRIRGVAIGGLLAFAPEVQGIAAGRLNGLYIDRIDLEDSLHFKLANQRFTGLSIGLVNYTAQLRGVRLGLLTYAGNNPRWARLLPLVGVHF